MIIHKPLNKIFSTYSNIAVLRELQHTTNGFTGREVAKRAGLSAPSAARALAQLESLKIVIRRIGGRDHLFTLNFSNYFVKEIVLPSLEAESIFYELIKKELTDCLSGKAKSVILFGSVARKEESIKSDFDICLVFKDAKNKKELENKLNDCRGKLFDKYGINAAAFYISLREFKKRAKVKRSPVDEIIKDGIILSGKSIKGLLNE